MCAAQLRLLPAARPLTERFGGCFFRNIPKAPGVYFFQDENRRLLYVGKANNLRQRINSYRFVLPDHRSRKIVRLVHATVHIQWDVCNSPQRAVEKESELLRLYRPPFNVAGTYPGQPFSLSFQPAQNRCTALIKSSGDTDEDCYGPFERKWIRAILALARLSHFATGPEATLTNLPAGLCSRRTHADLCLSCSAALPELARLCFQESAEPGLSTLRVRLGQSDSRCPFEQQLIQADLEQVEKFLEAHSFQAAESISPSP